MMTHGLKPMRIKIFFKSGNSVILDGVIEYSSRGRGVSVKGFIFQQQNLPSQTWLDVQSLDVASVEAVVRLPSEEASTLPTREA